AWAGTSGSGQGWVTGSSRSLTATCWRRARPSSTTSCASKIDTGGSDGGPAGRSDRVAGSAAGGARAGSGLAAARRAGDGGGDCAVLGERAPPLPGRSPARRGRSRAGGLSLAWVRVRPVVRARSRAAAVSRLLPARGGDREGHRAGRRRADHALADRGGDVGSVLDAPGRLRP